MPLLADTMLDTLLKVENILGIYRNYSLFNTRYKVLVLARTVVEFIFSTIVLVDTIHLILKNGAFDTKLQVTYYIFLHFVYYTNGTSYFLSAIYYTRFYESFLNNYFTVQKYFQNDSIYIKNFQNLRLFFKMSTFVTVLMTLFRTAFLLYENLPILKHESYLHLLLLSMLTSYIEIRFIMEHLIFFIHLKMLQRLLKCLNNSILIIQTKYHDKQMPEGVMETVEQWATHYICLKHCVEELSVSFKIQVSHSVNIH